MKIIAIYLIAMLCLVGCKLNDESAGIEEIVEEQSFEMSVSVSKLQGSLELTLNGDERVFISDSEISNDAESIFIGRFNAGDYYLLEVTKQPDSQYCSPHYSLSYNSGVFDDADITVHFFCQTYVRGLSGVTAVSAGDHHTCAIANNDVTCWGSNASGQLDIPADINNPTMISSGTSHSCVLEDTGIICWGEDEMPALKQPPQNLIDVQELKSGAGFSCAIDYEGLHCWGQGDIVSAEIDLVAPHSLTIERSGACVIDEGRVKCWGPYANLISYFELTATAITLGPDARICMTQLGAVICFRAGGSKIDSAARKLGLLSTSVIEFGQYGACAITEGRVDCWGGDVHGLEYIQHIVELPTAISIGFTHACAIQEAELICVGSNFNGEIDIPNL